MNILEFVQKQPFDWLGRTEAGSAILLVTKDDYESLRTLAARLAEAERDAARLTWAAANPVEAMREISIRWHTAGPGYRETRFDFRGAIDAAMAAETVSEVQK